MAPKESGTVKQKKPKEDSKKPKVGKVHVKPKDSDDNAPKEEHNVEDSDRKKKRRKSNGDAEGAADSDEKESKKNKPDASTDEKEQKPNKKPSKLAALFNKGKSNDSTETESIIPVHPALEYLTKWKKSHSSWKFQKVRQTWLLLHIYEEDKIPNSYFKILLDYIEDLKGSARAQTVEKATEIHRAAPHEGDDDDDNNNISSDKKTAEDKEAAAKKRVDRRKSERALEVLRVLS